MIRNPVYLFISIVILFFVGFQIWFFKFIKSNLIFTYSLQSQIIRALDKEENNIHSFIHVKGYLFAVTFNSPSKLLKLDPQNLNTIQTTIFPNDGYHNLAGDMIYVKSRDKIYVIFRGDKGTYLSEIDPDLSSFKDVFKLNIGTTRQSSSITTDEEYLYILTNDKPSIVKKISLSDFTEADNRKLVDLNFGHTIRYDGSNLFATGVDTPSWIAKIDPENFDYISRHFSTGENYATDDMAITNNDIFIGIETTSGVILRIDKNNLEIKDRIESGIPAKCFGVFFDGNNIWGLFDTVPGKIIRIKPDNLQKKTYSFSSDENSPNELVRVGKDVFFSFWMSPTKISKIRYY